MRAVHSLLLLAALPWVVSCSDDTAAAPPPMAPEPCSCPDGGTCTCPDSGACPDCPDCGVCDCPEAGTDAAEAGADSGPPVEVCHDGLDNDGDGNIDCEDADCDAQRCSSECVEGAWHVTVCESGACASEETVTVCNDGNVCTDTPCDDDLGCQVIHNEAWCSDGLMCTWGDSCSEGTCAGILEPYWSVGEILPVICSVHDCTEPAAYSKAQEFVAPHDRIGHVQVVMVGASVMPVELRILSDLPTPAGVAGAVDSADRDAKTLGTTTIHPRGYHAVHAYFEPQVDVTPGETYYLFMEGAVVFEDPAEHWKWHRDYDDPTSGPYKAGRMYILQDASAWTEVVDRDWSFKVHCDVDRYQMVPCEGGQFDPSTSICWESPPQDTGSYGLAAGENRCQDLTLEGHDDWRLPTIEELRGLSRGCPETGVGGACAVENGSTTADFVHEDCDGCGLRVGPHVDGCYWDEAMDGACSWLWSSSTAGSNVAWAMSLEAGVIGAYVTGATHRVRCVRDVAVTP